MKKVSLITGAAGGIGKATADVFRKSGWYVVGVDEKDKVQVQNFDEYIQADVSIPSSWEVVVRKLSTLTKGLDALVNNAAIQICRKFLETTVEEWDKTMRVNVRSAFLGMKYLYPFLKERKGAVVNVSSVHALATSKSIAAYAASKGALLALTRAMALEFGDDGIRVNAVLPGAVDTPMLHAGLERDLKNGSRGDGLKVLIEKHVLKRISNPTEIAEMIYFLSDSERSSFITGQSFVVDGGALARLSTE